MVISFGIYLTQPYRKTRVKTGGGLIGYTMDTGAIWRNDPNMSDADFLQQPPALRAEMAFYRELLEDKLRDNSDDEESDAHNIKPLEHVIFQPQNNEANPTSEVLLKRIKDAGIGTYGVVAARESDNGAIQIIYQSNAIDPSGETGVGGYWLLEGDPENGDWEDPIYLGLRTLLPYRIDGFAVDAPDAAPRQEEALRLVGSRQALDLGSLTFPPIAMEMADPERGLIIIDLVEVNRDSDCDTLTDLFEVRTGLNSNSPDTDADGIKDYRDSVPTRAYGGSSQERTKAYALLSILEHHEEGAIVGTPTTSDQGETGLLLGLQLNTDPESEMDQYRDPIPRVLYLQSGFEGLVGWMGRWNNSPHGPTWWGL